MWLSCGPNRCSSAFLGSALKVLGYAQGANLMVMKDEYMDNPLSEGTLAHELTHIQDARQSKGNRLPSYMLEGRALTIGRLPGVRNGDPVARNRGKPTRTLRRNRVGLAESYSLPHWARLGSAASASSRGGGRGPGRADHLLAPEAEVCLLEGSDRLGGNASLQLHWVELFR